MTTEDILTVKPEDDHSFYDYELRDALAQAENACIAAEPNCAAWFVHLEDGRMISGLRVEKETLSDGSVTCTVYLKTV